MPQLKLCMTCQLPVIPKVNNMLVHYLCGHCEHQACSHLRRSENICATCGVFSPFVLLRSPNDRIF